MVIASIMLMVHSATFMAYAMFYLVACFETEIPWLKCPETTKNYTYACVEPVITDDDNELLNNTLIASDFYFQ